MATAVWQDSSNDFDDTANWTGGAGTGGVPANGDTMVWASGTQGLTTNLTTGLTTMKARVGRGYGGDVGSASSRLDFDGTRLDFAGGGTWYVTGVISTIDVSYARSLTLYGNASTDVGTLRVIGGDGTITVESAAALDDLVTATTDPIRIILESGISGLATLTIDGGRVECSSNVSGVITVRSGQLTMKGSATAGSIIVKGNGYVDHQSSGTISTLETWDGGHFSLTNSEADSLTVSAATAYGGTMDLRSAACDVTLTAGIAYYSGLIYPPLGSTVTA